MDDDFSGRPSLYLHIPFCRSKCPYCDFYSQAGTSAQLNDYVELLLRHLALLHRAGELDGPLATVFFGGGTPSLLSEAQVARLFEQVRRTAGLTADAEISLEANPGTVDPARLRGYRRAGINRLSFGVQSLQDRALRLLGRGHSAQQALEAVAWARRAGFKDIGCDLMFGLPGQGSAELLADLAALLELQPTHVSCYGLAVEEGTPFARLQHQGRLQLPGEERYRELFLSLHEHLRAAGFHHYEISNYARPGHACRHNLAYWRRHPCFAVGAGGHGFSPAVWGRRLAVPADLQGYREALRRGRNPAQILETFDRRGAMAEVLYLGLRCAEGVAEEDFRRRFGCGVAEAFPRAVRRCGAHLTCVAGRWRFDLPGWLLYDHFIAFFL